MSHLHADFLAQFSTARSNALPAFSLTHLGLSQQPNPRLRYPPQRRCPRVSSKCLMCRFALLPDRAGPQAFAASNCGRYRRRAQGLPRVSSAGGCGWCWHTSAGSHHRIECRFLRLEFDGTAVRTRPTPAHRPRQYRSVAAKRPGNERPVETLRRALAGWPTAAAKRVQAGKPLVHRRRLAFEIAVAAAFNSFAPST